MRRHRVEMRVISDINLTNLVDTSFVLLLGFMLMAPAIKHGIELELPQVSQGGGDIQAQAKTLTIQIKKSDMVGVAEPIYLDDQRVTLDELGKIIAEKKRANPKMDVIVEEDRAATYEPLAQVLSLLKSMGIENVGLPTELTAPQSVKKK